jgi:hypothetical protein
MTKQTTISSQRPLLGHTRMGVLLLTLASLAIASCANSSPQKDSNDTHQSKRRNIVGYLA